MQFFTSAPPRRDTREIHTMQFFTFAPPERETREKHTMQFFTSAPPAREPREKHTKCYDNHFLHLWPLVAAQRPFLGSVSLTPHPSRPAYTILCTQVVASLYYWPLWDPLCAQGSQLGCLGCILRPHSKSAASLRTQNCLRLFQRHLMAPRSQSEF